MVSTVILCAIFLAVGVGFTYIITEIIARRNKFLFQFIKAIRKKKTIVFLETDKAIFWDTIEKFYKNLGLTKNKDVIILPKSSVKPVMNLGASFVHGDLYKSVTTPKEVRELIADLTKDGWADEEIAKFLEEVETTPADQLHEYYKSLIAGKNPKNPSVALTEDELKEQKEKITKRYNIYRNLSSVIKDFIYTGLNRVTVLSMIRELVYQRELEKMGSREWVKWALAIFLILVGVGFAVRFIISSPNIPQIFGGGNTPQPRINP